MKAKNCIVCQKIFDCYEDANKGARGINHKGKRGKNGLTCKKDCSKIYGRISMRVYSNYCRQIRILKKEIKKLKEK